MGPACDAEDIATEGTIVYRCHESELHLTLKHGMACDILRPDIYIYIYIYIYMRIM